MQSGAGVHDTVVNQLLTKIDGVDALNNILLIGMTNRCAACPSPPLLLLPLLKERLIAVLEWFWGSLEDDRHWPNSWSQMTVILGVPTSC